MIPVDYQTLVPLARELFGSLDGMPDASLHTARLRIADADITVRSTNRAVLDLYRQRLISAAPLEPPTGTHRFDIVAARELGWPSHHWSVPDWQMHVFDQVVDEGGYRAAYPYFAGQWIFGDKASGNAVHLLADMDDRLPWDAGSPLRHPLQWALANPRRRLAHAGSLSLNGHGVILVGPGGSGKSGTTLAGLAAGLQTVGDDYILLDLADGPDALPLYRVVKQDEAGLRRLPGVSGRLAGLAPNWQGKFEFDPERLFPGSLADRMRICGILMPRLGGEGRSSLEPVPRLEAASYLQEAMFPEPGREPTSDLLFLTALLLRAPAYRITLSTDPAEIAETIRAFIAGHAP